ncbi:lipocalin-like domain-containing protein [Chitinophaga rhizosphaerae]|uniref:lipocalin family protein n=1 Tax=Chitinophaga rhizosphaerae TaxID=1864947 RepID=UPI0013E0AFCB|nr:lipocalin family protein [Chitinophaga rhizosphaerae]
MRMQITFFAAALILFSACQNGQKRQTDQQEQNKATASEQPALPTKEKLTGKWTQPIPGQEPAIQGIEIKGDGSASSINMHTLIYEKWQLNGDTLLLWNHSTGVKEPIAAIDTTVITTLTDSTLVLTNSNGYQSSYTRGK